MTPLGDSCRISGAWRVVLEQIGRDDNNSARLIASSDMILDMILDPGLDSTAYFYSSNLLQKPYNSFH